MKSGDDCPNPKCSGYVTIADTQRRKRTGSVVRYLKCWKCGHDCGKVLLPHGEVPRRRKRH